MARNAKNRQKKLAKKKKKRSIKKKIINIRKNLSGNAASYSQFPVYECLIPSGLFDIGIGSILFARRLPNGSIAVSTFLVDVYCLGVKNALFHVISQFEYEGGFKDGIVDLKEDPIEIHPSCAKKIIVGAVSYAKNLGFSPHSDYRKASGLFSGIESKACPEKYEYGKDGKPFYVRGPRESISQANKIIEKLAKKCGEENFDYLVMNEDDIF